MVAWGPIPPVVENTRPLQVPFSIWVQRSPYFLSFPLSCLPYILAGVLCLALDLAPGCKTLISKNAISIGDHRPLAAMSSLAPSSRIVPGRMLSPVHGWSMGSTTTSLQIFSNILAMVSLRRLYLLLTKPPFLQKKIQFLAMLAIGRAYLSATASLNPRLLNPINRVFTKAQDTSQRKIILP